MITDVTERLKADEELKKAHDELELRVEQRTAELIQINVLKGYILLMMKIEFKWLCISV